MEPDNREGIDGLDAQQTEELELPGRYKPTRRWTMLFTETKRRTNVIC